MLRDPELNAVEILTPQLLHEEMVIAAAEAGKHIALQKPMAVSLDSADRMIEAAEKADVSGIFDVIPAREFLLFRRQTGHHPQSAARLQAAP